jgi:hypothetical protein
MIRRTPRHDWRLIAMSALLPGVLQAAEGVQYRLGYDAGSRTYGLYMRASATPSNSTSLAGAQVTIKAPTSAKTPFTVTNFRNLIGSWRGPGSITPAPRESPSTDYLSFDLSNITDFGFVAGVEKLVFTFQNANACIGPVALMENSDPFNKLPNSASTNPGNHIAVFGLNNNADKNDFLGTYGSPVSCTAATAQK